jgi:hypothetical protein
MGKPSTMKSKAMLMMALRGKSADEFGAYTYRNSRGPDHRVQLKAGTVMLAIPLGPGFRVSIGGQPDVRARLTKCMTLGDIDSSPQRKRRGQIVRSTQSQHR